jgi:sigma-B regulation protein RsbU (phosphoserine phosphatase)
MTSSIRILHLEDDPNDAELIALQLASDGWTPDIVLVKSHAEYTAALGRGGFEVILADNSGPSFKGRDALALAREKLPNVPFLFVSGSAVGDAAVAAMKSGADGYVSKNDLSQLAPTIERALDAKK